MHVSRRAKGSWGEQERWVKSLVLWLMDGLSSVPLGMQPPLNPDSVWKLCRGKYLAIVGNWILIAGSTNPYKKNLYRVNSVSSPFHQIPWSRILLEKLTTLELVNKFSAFYGTRSSITVFTSARHLSLFWATAIQSMLPHPTSHFQVVFINSILLWCPFYQRDTRWISCLRHCSSNLKVAGSITDGGHWVFSMT
jgi:hypothetical protein